MLGSLITARQDVVLARQPSDAEAGDAENRAPLATQDARERDALWGYEALSHRPYRGETPAAAPRPDSILEPVCCLTGQVPQPTRSGRASDALLSDPASLSTLPDELTLMLAAQLSLRDALVLRRASPDFARVSFDAAILRDYYERAELLVPADLTTLASRQSAWGKLNRFFALRRQYAIGPVRSHVFSGHCGKVSFCSFSQDNLHLVTASADGTARVWSLHDGVPPCPVLPGHHRAVTSATFSPDGAAVVTAAADGTVRIWNWVRDARQSLILDTLTGSQLWGIRFKIPPATFCPDGRFVATASSHHTGRVWDYALTPPQFIELEGHQDYLTSVLFSPDGKSILTSSHDGTARVWNFKEQPAQATVLDGHIGGLTFAIFSPDGASVVTASSDQVQIWRWQESPPRALTLEGQTSPTVLAAFSPTGRFVVTAHKDGSVRMWDSDRAAPQGTVLRGHNGRIYAVAFSPDGHFLLTASLDGKARLWDTTLPTPVPIAIGSDAGPIFHAAFSPDGRFVVLGRENGSAELFDFARTPPVSKTNGRHALTGFG